MSGELIEHIAGIDASVEIFEDRVEVVQGDAAETLRYEEMRSVNLRGNPIFSELVIKAQSGRATTIEMLRQDGLRARRLIKARRWRLKKLRESGFESQEDFEAKASELGKRLGLDSGEGSGNVDG
jgi:hypothetical protein